MLQIVPRSVALSAATPVAVELEDPAAAAAHAAPAQQLEHDVLRLHPRPQAPAQLDPDHDGPLDRYGRPAIATATSVAPAPIASMPSAPAIVVWLSAPTQHLPGPGEPLEVEVVRDPVAGARVEQRRTARPSCAGSAWSSGFLLSNCSTLWSTYGARSAPRPGRAPSCSNWRQAIVPGRVLEQDLVDAELELLVRAADQVLGDDLLRERPRPGHEQRLVLGGRPLRCARRHAVRGFRRRHPQRPAARRRPRGRGGGRHRHRRP